MENKEKSMNEAKKIFNILEHNSTINEMKQSPKNGWRSIIFCYLIYVGVMSLTKGILTAFGIKDMLSLTLTAYFISAFACVAFILFVEKRSFKSLGMGKESFKRNYLYGWGFAILCLLVVFGINIMFNGVETLLNSDFNIVIFLFLLIGFVFQGFLEEFLFRSLLMSKIASKQGVIFGIVINSILFGLGHVNNSSSSLISVVNTFLLGALFSLMFYYHDDVWFVSGFHSGWNFVLGPVLGIVVSGFTLPTTLLETKVNETLAAMNGGSYGFEASYTVTALFILVIVMYIYLIKKNGFYGRNKARKSKDWK